MYCCQALVMPGGDLRARRLERADVAERVERLDYGLDELMASVDLLFSPQSEINTTTALDEFLAQELQVELEEESSHDHSGCGTNKLYLVAQLAARIGALQGLEERLFGQAIIDLGGNTIDPNVFPGGVVFDPNWQQNTPEPGLIFQDDGCAKRVYSPGAHFRLSYELCDPTHGVVDPQTDTAKTITLPDGTQQTLTAGNENERGVEPVGAAVTPGNPQIKRFRGSRGRAPLQGASSESRSLPRQRHALEYFASYFARKRSNAAKASSRFSAIQMSCRSLLASKGAEFRAQRSERS